MGTYEDRTDPYRVKARRHRVERHDHRNGVCDLLADPQRVGWTAGACYLDVDRHDPEMRCSCEMCSLGARARGRRIRRDGKRQARAWLDA